MKLKDLSPWTYHFRRPRNHPQIHKINQIEGFEPWDPSHEKERAKICRKLKSRASETVWASSYGQITVLKPRIWIFAGEVPPRCRSRFVGPKLGLHDPGTPLAQQPDSHENPNLISDVRHDMIPHYIRSHCRGIVICQC